MNPRKLLVATSAALLLASSTTLAHEKPDQLGKVTFATSCAPKVQKQFETGVAMLHSYWFGEAKKTFEAVLKDDPNCAIAHWGIALDYLGNTLAGAKAEVAAMQAIRTTLEKTDLSYWADRTEEQMLAVSAWVALADGNKAQAEKLMQAAAEREDGSVKSVLMENRLYPLRELYAELLLEIGQAAPALREFETALKAYPNRYRTLYGIARAAEAAGDRRKAAEFYAKLTAQTKNADTQRPELAKARTYVAQR